MNGGKTRRILFISGTPRDDGNSELLARRCASAAGKAGAKVEFWALRSRNIMPCAGCLQCNKLKTCAFATDDWPALRDAFLASDAVVIASPVYFHGISAILKNALDRFRSVLRVRFTPSSLIHDTVSWPAKDVAVILTQGEPIGNDFESPLQNLKFFSKLVCRADDVRTLIAKGLTIAAQVEMDETRLRAFWRSSSLDPNVFIEFRDRFASYRDLADTLGRNLAEGASGPAGRT